MGVRYTFLGVPLEYWLVGAVAGNSTRYASQKVGASQNTSENFAVVTAVAAMIGFYALRTVIK
jgi:hypothetical protein